MSDPGAAAGAHDRLERGDEAARGDLQGDLAVGAVVDVGLAVRDDQHLGAGQFLLEQPVQRLRRPFDVNAVGEASLEAHLGENGVHLPADRKIAALRLAVARITGLRVDDGAADGARPAAHQAEHDRGREQAEADGHADEGEHGIEPRLSRPFVDVGEVVQDQQMAGRRAGRDRKGADMDALPASVTVAKVSLLSRLMV